MKRGEYFFIQCTLIKHICFRPQLTLNLAVAFVIFLGGIFLCIQLETEDRRKRAENVYIPPLIRTIKRMVGRALHVLSHWRTFNRPIIQSFVRPYRIILQQSLSLYSSRIQTQDKSQDSIRIDRTTVALNRASFVRVPLNMR